MTTRFIKDYGGRATHVINFEFPAIMWHVQFLERLDDLVVYVDVNRNDIHVIFTIFSKDPCAWTEPDYKTLVTREQMIWLPTRLRDNFLNCYVKDTAISFLCWSQCAA